MLAHNFKPVDGSGLEQFVAQSLSRRRGLREIVRRCRIRFEKFRGGLDGQWGRDVTLIEEAHAVLLAALAWPDRTTACRFGAPD